MLTKKSTLTPQTEPPRHRRRRGPALALASFVGVALLGVAVWLVTFYGGSDETSTAGPQVTTTLPEVVTPEMVSVPDLAGLTLEEARSLLADAGLDVLALPNHDDSAIVLAQEPAPRVDVDEGSVVTVDVQITPTCNPPDPIAPEVGQTTIAVFYECGGDAVAPTAGMGVPRIVPEQGGEAIDRIEWTLRSLLAGPNNDERIAGFESAFDAATADALNSVTLVEGHLIVDFNDAIIVNNMNTSTGMIFFNAELHRNVFHQPEVDSVEFHFEGDCGAWSGLFESNGCRIITRADWEQDLADWDQLRNQ